MSGYCKIGKAILVLTVLGASVHALGQDAVAAEQTAEQYDLFDTYDIVVVPLEHVEASKVMKLLYAFSEDGMIMADDDLNALLLTAPKSISERLQEAIKLLDVPPKKEQEQELNVELTVRLIEGTSEKSDEPYAEGVIPSLKPVVDELMEVFSYERYRLVDTLFLRCRDGKGVETSGTLPGDPGPAGPSTFTFAVDKVAVTSGDPRGVSLDEVQFIGEIPFATPSQQSGRNQVFNQIQRRNLGLEADINVREGQQVVVGKASMLGGDSALFVVVSASIVGD